MAFVMFSAIAICLTIPAAVLAFLFYSDWAAQQAESARDDYAKKHLANSL